MAECTLGTCFWCFDFLSLQSSSALHCGWINEATWFFSFSAVLLLILFYRGNILYREKRYVIFMWFPGSTWLIIPHPPLLNPVHVANDMFITVWGHSSPCQEWPLNPFQHVALLPWKCLWNCLLVSELATVSPFGDKAFCDKHFGNRCFMTH